MIGPDVRNAIYQLHQVGCPLREISRKFQVSRHSVRRIIKQQGAVPKGTRKDKIQIDGELLERLYRECDGWVQRMHEKLVEEEGISIGYATLTRLVREQGIGGGGTTTRCDHVPDEPGAEMQHDTTVYQVKLGDQPTRVIASLLYLRYSKRRYLRFYHRFNRFVMKCFLHEALVFWGYAPRKCVIDNTNLARLRGTGRNAVIVPEMALFAEQYGFEFACHELMHSNRKAGEERSFWTVETNFLPGRTFGSLEDLNRQALEWATVRNYHRAAAKTGLIPAKAFELERSWLQALPPQLPAPHESHERTTDQYGYVAFQGNYYWVPGSHRGEMKVLAYADRLKLFRRRELLIEYPLPPEGTKNERFAPAGQPAPRRQPKHRKRSSELEEQRLRALGPEFAAYLDYALQTLGIQRHRFLRGLWSMHRRLTAKVFALSIERALRYRIVELGTLENIAWYCLSLGEEPMPDLEVDESFRERPAYLEGSLTDEPDLSIYDPLPLDNEPGDEPDEPPPDAADTEDRPF
jgi:transposase